MSFRRVRGERQSVFRRDDTGIDDGYRLNDDGNVEEFEQFDWFDSNEYEDADDEDMEGYVWHPRRGYVLKDDI